MKRKIPPMPVEFFATHPKIIGLNTAGLGTLTRLLLHFWMTDCSPLPETDYALFLLSRSHKPTWSTYKREIREILDEICPQLEKALVLYRQRSSILRGLTERGAAARRKQALQKVSTPVPAFEPMRHERNRSQESAGVKPAGAGFVDKAR